IGREIGSMIEGAQKELGSRIGGTEENRKTQLKKFSDQMDRIEVVIGQLHAHKPAVYDSKINELERQQTRLESAISRIQSDTFEEVRTYSKQTSAKKQLPPGKSTSELMEILRDEVVVKPEETTQAGISAAILAEPMARTKSLND